jgi:2,4-dienoyl-CoA reductase-like NADH-dependent reductase (Old Yellow Enzyme family)
VSEPLLFQPIVLRELKARNRIVVSPMCQYSAKDGHVGDWHLVHLGKFAQGGAGIVFVEATAVERRGRITHGDTGIWDDAHIPGLKRIADFVRSQGALPAIQLAHAGRKASMARPWYGNGPLTQEDSDRGDKPWSIVGPTDGGLGEGWIQPRAFQPGDFQTVLTAYRNAVRRTVAAGFDIIEIHGAHGYLLHSFCSPLSNLRTDEYGGSFEGRVRLPLEVAAAVRAAWPADKPVFYRLSATDWYDGGWDLAQSTELCRRLKDAGIDLVDVSSGGNIHDQKIALGPGYQVPFAEAMRKQVGMPTLAVGLISDAVQAEQIVFLGQADAVCLARALLRDPYWPRHAAKELKVDMPWPDQYKRSDIGPLGR